MGVDFMLRCCSLIATQSVRQRTEPNLLLGAFTLCFTGQARRLERGFSGTGQLAFGQAAQSLATHET